MADVIHVRGEGGSIFVMGLPLQRDIAHRLERGHLRRVNPDGSPWREPDESAASDVPTLPTERPALNAPKGAWVGWAVANGMTPDVAEALTKPDLIDRFGTAAPLVEGE